MRYSTILALATVFGAVSLTAGCDRKSEVADKGEPEIKPTVYVPPPVKHYEGTPYWEVQSKTWPQLMAFAVNPDGEYTRDSLYMRLTGTVIQSFVDGPKSKHPLMCWIELTLRPIPKKLIGRSFDIDSVVFFDPIKKRLIPSLPMLSAERFTELGVVRTVYSNNLATVRDLDFVENQLLEPTVYITTVDKKTMKITMPPLTLTFLMEIESDPIPIDSLKWGPS